jgi:hypothetical protein
MNTEIILFLEDLKNLLLELDLGEEKNETIIEAIDLIDDKILHLES